jgi:hypothetical protein
MKRLKIGRRRKGEEIRMAGMGSESIGWALYLYTVE